jgi:hypothetical protein
MFSSLRSYKAGKNLEEANFKAGDWNTPWEGQMRMPSVVDDLRSLVACSVVEGQEACKSIEDQRYEWGGKSFEWRWDGGAFVFDEDIDDCDYAKDSRNVEEMEKIKKRIRKRLSKMGIEIPS